MIYVNIATTSNKQLDILRKPRHVVTKATEGMVDNCNCFREETVIIAQNNTRYKTDLNSRLPELTGEEWKESCLSKQIREFCTAFSLRVFRILV